MTLADADHRAIIPTLLRTSTVTMDQGYCLESDILETSTAKSNADIATLHCPPASGSESLSEQYSVVT
jgi:hypothetical protein